MSASRIERLKARLKEIPDRPGVYLHKNAEGQVIYVGKARNLKNRVTSYVVGKGTRAHPLTNALIPEIEDIDFVTTNNELEAILLENNLIKTHQPRYNVLLRDDKTYPYIKVTMSEDYPRVVFTRRMDRKKGDLFFFLSLCFFFSIMLLLDVFFFYHKYMTIYRKQPRSADKFAQVSYSLPRHVCCLGLKKVD